MRKWSTPLSPVTSHDGKKGMWSLSHFGAEQDLTNGVICRVVLGKKYGEGERGNEFKTLLRDFNSLTGSVDIGNFVPCLGWVNWVTGVDAKIERVAKGFDEFLEGLVEDCLKLDTDDGDDGEGNNNFLDRLLQIYKDNSAGISFDRDCLKAQIMTAFAGGTDTTYTFLEWAMSELLRNPRVMRKVQDEVREILSFTGKPETVEEDLEKMQYLKAVIKEAFRLHPPIPLLIPHEAREDIRVMVYDNIVAGTMVVINAWAIGRDPSTWDEPNEFRPERFLNCPIDFRGHDFQLIPFGAGRRGCPGISFVTVIGELILANLLHKFNWSLPGGAKGEDLDMTECGSGTVHRKFSLIAVATPR
ncbi:cytochrome P450 71A8-like [Rhododendron vialii]|uniref:cytochrome P450 71A8-like n=1 Tax=Rhododendron vialii TaxID=182163 RepID=UPI00265F7D8E|nr:cytochrome P450 71A8-like [Rhododendron vialii]